MTKSSSSRAFDWHGILRFGSLDGGGTVIVGVLGPHFSSQKSQSGIAQATFTNVAASLPEWRLL